MHLPIRTPSLILRHFIPEDATVILALSREEGMRTWLPSQVYVDSAEALSVLEFLIRQYESPADPRKGPYVLAIEHAVDRRLIGHVGFSPLEGEVEIGFAIGEHDQKRGYAAEAIAASCGWVFESFGLSRILGVTAAGNLASKRAMAHAGFGHLEDRTMCFQGTEQPVAVYALTVDDRGQ